MNKTITMFKRVGAVLACLAMLCGVIMSSVVLPAVSAAPTDEVKTFDVNFANLAALVDSTKYTNGLYQSTATDTAINEWVNARFGVFVNRENSRYKEKEFLGQGSFSVVGFESLNGSAFNDNWGGEINLKIAQNGALQHSSTKVGDQQIRKSHALTVKNSYGDYAELANFQAEIVFNKGNNDNVGAVYVSFHEKEPGKMWRHNSATNMKVTSGNEAVIVGRVDSSNDGIIVGNVANTNTKTGYTNIGKLDNNADYKLTVKVVGTALTATVTKVADGSVVHTSSKTIAAGSGSLSVGLANCVRNLKSVKVTELDENGTPVDFGQKRTMQPFEWTLENKGWYGGGKYYADGAAKNPWYDFADQNTDTAKAIIAALNKQFDNVYNCQGSVKPSEFGKKVSYSGQTKEYVYFRGGYVNHYLQMAVASLGGYESMRHITSLVPKGHDGKQFYFQNFEATFEVRMNNANSNPVSATTGLLGFRQQTAGQFTTGWFGMSQQQGMVAFTTHGYNLAAGTQIIGARPSAANAAEDMYNKMHNAFATPAAKENILRVTVRAVGDQVYLKIVNTGAHGANANTVMVETTITVPYTEPGYLAFGIGNRGGDMGNISLKHLDENGNEISLYEQTQTEKDAQASASATHRELDFADIPGAEYTGGKYTAVGQNYAYFSQFDTSVLAEVESDVQMVFNDAATHVVRSAELTGKGRWLLFYNRWLQLTGSPTTAATRIGNINALVPLDENGYRQKLADTAVKFDFNIEKNTTTILVGLRQNVPGLFMTGENELNKNQLLVAITKNSIRVAGGDDITWDGFAIANDAEYTDDAFSDVFATPLQTGDNGAAVSVEVKAYGKKVEVVIRNNTGSLLYSGTFTTDYTAAGYTAIGASNTSKGNVGAIRLSKVLPTGYFTNYPKTTPKNFAFDDGKARFVADFAPLANKVVAFKDGVYTPTANDSTVNVWFSDKFALRYNRENVNADRMYLGQPSTELDAEGVNTYWGLGESGTLIRKADTVGAHMLEQYDSLVLKAPNGLTATMQNFVAEYTVYDAAREKGAVVLSFRSKARGTVADGNKSVYADQSMVIIGADKNGDVGLTVADGFNADAATYTTVENKIDALKDVDGYKVTVKAIGANVAVVITSLDGTETYYTNESAPATVTNVYNGYISIGVTNGTKALGDFVLTELDAAGAVVDFGTNTREAGEEFFYSVKDVITYTDGKYNSGAAHYDFEGKYGENAEEDASTLINHLDNKFAIYYSSEGGYGQMEAGVKEYKSGQTNNYASFSTVYSNKWLQRTVSGVGGYQTFRLITSLVPRNAVTGEELRFKNFETSFNVRFEQTAANRDRNSVVVGFRQQVPGKFSDAYYKITKEQGFVAISRKGLAISAGDDIYAAYNNVGGSHVPAEGDMYNSDATATFDSTLPDEVTIKVRVVNDKVVVTITDVSGGTVYYDNSAAPVTINYDKEGYLALGVGSGKMNIGEISVKRLDDIGEQMDVNGNDSVPGCPWDTSATRFSETMNQTEDQLNVLYDFYYHGGTNYVAKEALTAHWTLSDVLTRANDLGESATDNLATMLVKKDATTADTFKNFDAVFKVNLDATKNSTFWVIGRQTDDATLGQVVKTAGGTDYHADRLAVGVSVGGKVTIALGDGTAAEIAAPTAGTPTGTYNIRVRVYGRMLEVSVNGTLRATRTLPDALVKEGKLSFGVAGQESAVASLYLTRLNEYGIPVDYEGSEYTDYDTVEPPMIGVGETLDTSVLPSTITIYKGTTPETSDVFWDVTSVDNSAEGDAYIIGYLRNTNGIRVVQPVYVGKYNRGNTTVYKFDSAAELEDFESWYLPSTNGTDVPAIHTEGTDDDTWVVKNGVLAYQNNSIRPSLSTLASEEGFTYNNYVYKDDRGWAGYASYHGIAVLKTQKYKNFVLDVDVKSNGRWAPVGFGAQDYNDPLGVHANQKNGGYSFHVEYGSTASSTAKVWGYRESAEASTLFQTATFAGYQQTAYNHLRIVVTDGVAMFYINHAGAAVLTIDLPDTYEGGYIYLTLNQDSNSYDNLKIVDLDKEPIVITDLVTEMDDSMVDREAGEELKNLQAEVTVADANGYEYVISSDWISDDFRSDKEGTFTFKFDTSKAWHGFDLSALAGESFEVTNKIGNAYNRGNTVKYYFESALELEDFESWYMPTTNGIDIPAIHTEGTANDNWIIRNNALTYKQNEWYASSSKLAQGFTINGFEYKDERSYSGYASNHALAVLKTQKYENFILDVDVKSDGRWAPVGFGLDSYNDKMAVHASQKDAGYSFHVEYGSFEKSTAKIWGYRAETGTSSMFKQTNFSGYQHTAYNHLRIVVSDGVAMFYINYDGTPVLTYELPDTYNGGYIYLSLNQPNTSYDNLKIVDLDKEEIVITDIVTETEDITIDREAGEELVLPREITVKDANGFEYAIAVEWASEDYRSWKEGTSTFTLNTEKAWHNFDLSALAGAGFEVTNNIGAEHNTAQSRKYYFDHENDLLDFYTQVSQHGYNYTKRDGTVAYDKDYHSGYDGILVPKDDAFRIMNGQVTNTNAATGMGSGWNNMRTMRGVASAVLKDVNFYNFKLEFDFTHSGMWYTYGIVGVQDQKWTQYHGKANWGENRYWEQTTIDQTTNQPVKAWKETDIGKTYLSSAGIWTHLEQEGYINIQGDHSSKNVRFTQHSNGGDIKSKYETAKPHHMSLTVVDGLLTVEIDNNGELYYAALNETALGGLVGFGSHQHGSHIDNFQITALDFKGDPIDWADAVQGEDTGWAPTPIPDDYLGWKPKDDFVWGKEYEK